MKTIAFITFFTLLPFATFAATSTNFQTDQEATGFTEFDASSTNFQFKAIIGQTEGAPGSSTNFQVDSGKTWEGGTASVGVSATGGGAGSGGGTGPAPVFDEEPAIDESCPEIGDLNGDCRVNLVDFSIAVFWYNKPLSADFIEKEQLINGDGVVDLVDFSIMAFHWTG